MRPRRDVPQDGVRRNEQIRAREVRVIGPEGEQIGILPCSDAIAMAHEQGYDLVEVAANAEPPVCRIMDFGKFKYEQQQKKKEAKKGWLLSQSDNHSAQSTSESCYSEISAVLGGC